jgi:peptide/nickel transport system substrate-binding protein
VLTDDQAGVVTFVLSKPNSEFLYQLAGLNAYPVPPSVPMNTSIEGAFPGTGPYTVTYHDEGIVKLTRNPNFSVWDADARPDAFADEIDFITQPDPEAAVSMVERGDADYIRLTVADRPSDATLDRIRSQLTAQLRFAPDAPGSVTLNTSIAPFNSLEARQAINMAIDRQHMVDLRGGSSAAAISCQYLPSGWPAHQPYCPYTTHPDPGGRWQAPDLDAARALVARSGTLGAKVVVGPTLDIFADEREYVATVLAELGYDVTTDTDTSGEHVSSVHEAGQVQVSVWEWFKATLTPADQLAPFTCERSAGTFSYYCDPAFDALVAEAANLQATDVAAANEKWAQADRMLVDAAPWAPVFNEGSDFISSRVGNYQYHLFYGALLDQMWVQ